jgi:ketosteroid isomerase-like protein
MVSGGTQEEIMAIERLRYEYCHLLDDGMIDELMQLFTEDAICEFGPLYGGDHKGKKAIETFFRAAAQQFPKSAFHTVVNPLIEVTGEQASGRWYVVTSVLRKDDVPLRALGRSQESYRKVDGRWLFARLRVDLLYHGS